MFPVEPSVIIPFLVAVSLVELTPGPNMSLIIANTLRGGLASGLVTLTGTTTGLALLVGAAALGIHLATCYLADQRPVYV